MTPEDRMWRLFDRMVIGYFVGWGIAAVAHLINLRSIRVRHIFD